MFAGIITHVGRIASATAQGDGVRLRIEARDFGLGEVKIGDSISIQGACHTVVAKTADHFEVDTSRATLAVTTGLESGREVNLEKSLRLSDRLDGHLVAGHVDGVGTVAAFDDLGGSFRLAIDAPKDLAHLLARKGSVAVDGVSLTVNAVDGARFEVNIIPHTRSVTTIRNLAPGARVNLEADVLARYVERILESGKIRTS
ncbi:riboflavin synthase [Usitatibacter palustris]|uniref:Riboflavin synthase n=1 Tax=Usitatibacter palustris TaxID=2732487 RepID=A0A6M4H4Z9_9PROT|nr:riboflavin synthase [Usitatibacter palustris]QJR14721.1 Riboflavin synthase [Usitatibacter palustris]